MHSEYDVVVAGGGTAGVVAAVQAGRAGARTLLVERAGVLGGTMVAAAINYPASFHAWGRQVIAGIGWELVCKTLRETGQPVPDGTACTHGAGLLHVPVDRAVFAALADEAVVGAGVDMLLHTMPAAAGRHTGGWNLTLCTKTGLKDVRARVLVDCTGDANLVSLAGLPVRRVTVRQPGTLFVTVGGYDANALDYPAIQTAFDGAVAQDRLRKSDVGWQNGNAEFFLRSYGGNRIHVVDIDGADSESRTVAELEGRRAMLRLLRFFRALKGLEDLRIQFFADECGIRETVTIEGRKTITAHDYESGRVWDDAVCYSHYCVDVHCDTRVFHRNLPQGVCATIPLGAMLPAGGEGLIVAGRCISGDREAHSAYRVEATCMATGQAAGAAAALATKAGVNVGQVPLADLRSLLRAHGAIVPGEA
jgi:hypothetical protein